MAEPGRAAEDHGTFRIQVDDEAALVGEAIRRAAGNIDGAPGQYWLRLVARFQQEDSEVELIRMWGVDLLERTLVSRELEGEKETACQQRSLTEEEIKAATGAL